MPRAPQLRWIRPPQQARSQETLERILDAAERLVAEKGFEDATVAEVVRRAGSSVGAFYARFADKDALLYALYDRYLAQALATADDALDPTRWEGARVGEILDSVVRFLVEIYREQGGLIRAFVVRNHVDLVFRARQDRLSHAVAERLTALLFTRREEIRHPQPERAVALGLAMTFATIEAMVLFGETRASSHAFSDDELARELGQAFRAYLDVRGEAAATSPSQANPPQAHARRSR